MGFYSELSNSDKEKYREFVYDSYGSVQLTNYKLEGIDQYGGEGQGDDYWVVFSATDKNGHVTNYRLDGWYASYDGFHFDELEPYEVEEKEVLIKKWFRK